MSTGVNSDGRERNRQVPSDKMSSGNVLSMPRKELVFDVLGEFACGNGMTVTLDGYDSSCNINGQTSFIRGYGLRLNALTPAALRDFVTRNNLNEQSILPDGSGFLLSRLFGEAMRLYSALHELAETGYSWGVNIPAELIYRSACLDMDSYGETYMARVEQK
jgi:hypothetical protein